MAREFDKASDSAFSLKGAVAALGLVEIFHAGKEALVDFNMEMDKLKIGMTTVMESNLHMPFEKARKEADKLFYTFQQLAKKSPVTTKDYMEMASMISPAVAMAGGGPDKLAKLTQGAITAGLAYGSSSQLVGMDIQEMLMGNVTKRNRLGNQLLGSVGMESKEFNAKSGSDRAQLVEKMLDSPGLKHAAERFGETFAGMTSTFKDNIQIALGEVGKPLMVSMTAEVKKWNTWIEKHPQTIAKIQSQLTSMVKSGFDFIQNSVSWLVDHKDTILEIGKIFVAFKGAQMATGILSNAVNGVASFVKGLQGAGTMIAQNGASLSGGFSSIASVITGAGGLIPAFTALGAAVWILKEHMWSESEDNKRAKDFGADIQKALGMSGSDSIRMHELQQELKTGKLPGGSIMNEHQMGTAKTELDKVSARFYDPENMGKALKGMNTLWGEKGLGENSIRDMSLDEKGLDIFGKSGMSTNEFNSLYTSNKADQHVIAEIENFLKDFSALSHDQKMAAMQSAFPDQFPATQKVEEGGWHPTNPEKTDVHVTIEKIEVASEDPDRFVFGLVKALGDVGKHPTQARSSLQDM